jgi:hypothetical protein
MTNAGGKYLQLSAATIPYIHPVYTNVCFRLYLRCLVGGGLGSRCESDNGENLERNMGLHRHPRDKTQR